MSYVTLKFRSTYRFLLGHELANSVEATQRYKDIYRYIDMDNNAVWRSMLISLLGGRWDIHSLEWDMFYFRVRQHISQVFFKLADVRYIFKLVIVCTEFCLSEWETHGLGSDHEFFAVSHIRFLLLLFAGCLSNGVILFESSKILSCSHRYSAFPREKWRKPGMH